MKKPDTAVPLPSLAAALQRADLIHPRAVLDQAIARMGSEIDRDLAGTRPLFVSVMNGAVVFAGPLALAMTLDCEFDYVHATRYRGATEGGALQWLRRPAKPMAGRTVLLVDDILDEGNTLKAIRDYCLNEGAKRVAVAVLSRKMHDRCVPGIKADYIGVEVPDRYVFGFGMDYYEQGRNLPGIYAI